MILESPLPLTIKCDWTRMNRVYQKLLENFNYGFFDDVKQWVPNAKYTACDIGVHGRWAVDNKTVQPWFLWTGPLLESIIPWAKKLREKTARAGILLQNFGYHYHDFDIYKHVDSKETADRKYQSEQCNINFIIKCSDPPGKSFFERADGTHYYVSQENCAYLIDSSVPHWVENQSYREILQIRFHSRYDMVKDFFQKNPLELE